MKEPEDKTAEAPPRLTENATAGELVGEHRLADD